MENLRKNMNNIVEKDEFVRDLLINETGLSIEEYTKFKPPPLSIYLAFVEVPLDLITQKVMWEEEPGLKVGMTGKGFVQRWENKGYTVTCLALYIVPTYITREECIKIEKATIYEARDAGYPPHIFKLNTMGKCTETFHLDALPFIQKQFVILNKMDGWDLKENYEL